MCVKVIMVFNPVNDEQSKNDTEAKIVDIGTQFKKACAELSLDKFGCNH